MSLRCDEELDYNVYDDGVHGDNAWIQSPPAQITYEIGGIYFIFFKPEGYMHYVLYKYEGPYAFTHYKFNKNTECLMLLNLLATVLFFLLVPYSGALLEDI